MKRFLTSTAAALILSTSAYADGHSSAFSELTFDESVNLNASELIGARVYITETEIQNDTMIEADGEKEWEDIGEINEIILKRDGSVQSVIVGVGGFAGIGEKDVAIDMSQLKFVSDGEDANDYFLVVNSNVAGVEEAPAYEYEYDNDEAGDMDKADTMEKDESMEKADNMEADVAADPKTDRPMLTAPEIERDGYAAADRDELTTEDLTGARVYGPDDEDVGEISELIVTEEGKIDRAIIDVGGFLGLGEHSVAVTLDELNIVREADGDDLRVYIDSTQEALEQQPEYEG